MDQVLRGSSVTDLLHLVVATLLSRVGSLHLKNIVFGHSVCWVCSFQLSHHHPSTPIAASKNILNLFRSSNTIVASGVDSSPFPSLDLVCHRGGLYDHKKTRLYWVLVSKSLTLFRGLIRRFVHDGFPKPKKKKLGTLRPLPPELGKHSF